MGLRNRISGRVYLWSAIILFAASNSIARILTNLGAQHLVEGRNPISLCNVLFVGNLCALAVLVPYYYQQLNPRLLKQFSRTDWIVLLTVAILSGALAPSLIFQALSITSVTSVVLIGRIEPPLILILSIWLLRERVSSWEIAGATVSLVGVALTVLLQSPGADAVNMGFSFTLGKGELFTLIGVTSAAIATVISKTRLAQVHPGVFSVIRTLVGTIVFFSFAAYLFGFEHFADAFSPFLWQWMLVYGTIIVAVGQVFWFTGLKATTASEASLANSFSPVIGILFAYLLLNEQLTTGHYLGGTLIIVGLVLSQIGIRRKTPTFAFVNKFSRMKQAEAGLGFKGI